ncbi:hypothetical protein LPJ64_002222 [Coemansia asiatica]|uniref:Peptide hydrolase n=1 Tax=Coemansia asiatica TaxID=1052880 RepID=A0A9W7XK04_9FUNG|nr:hypothetical protein LPJ64_002222 [Coemansia asiatica]
MRFTLITIATLAVAAVSVTQAREGNQHHFGAVGHHYSVQAAAAAAAVAFEQQAAAGGHITEDMHPGTLYSSKRLIKVSENTKPRWLGLEDILALRRAGVGFMDITDTQDMHHQQDIKALGEYESRLPTKLSHGKQVRGAIGQLSTKLYGDVLNPFTAFHNRYYDSEYGRKSSEWLKAQIESLVDQAKANVTVEAFKHKFPQSSTIARFYGKSEETVVISAHQDSVNMWLPWFGRASGADDDGSGTVTILEAFRVLLHQGFAPERTVEFHWYAGEEGGLLGSQDVARQYKKQETKVVGNLHFDMTGFWEKGSEEIIGLVADRTDPKSRALVSDLANEYTRLKTKEFECGYGCSDHASWNAFGFPSAMAFECDKLEANTNVHSPKDTVETLDFDHMLEFSKLAVAYAYEVGYDKTD